MENETIDARSLSTDAKTKSTSNSRSENLKLLSGHNLFMAACCAAMIAGTGIYVAFAPADQSFAQKMLLAAPLLGCVGMHFVLHRLMGKPCHSSSNAGGSK